MESVCPAVEQKSPTVKFYYKKRHDSASREPKQTATDREVGNATDPGRAFPCNVENPKQFQLGAFYAIDHSKLLPKFPTHLKSIRVVKVIESRDMEVTVSFPSMLSLRQCFGSDPASDESPDLDERFVMGTNQATRILGRVISPSQLEAEKHLATFWLTDLKLQEEEPMVVIPLAKLEAEEHPEEEEQGSSWAMGSCVQALRGALVGGWGIRRRVKYIGRHNNQKLPPVNNNQKEESVEKPMEMDVRMKRLRERTAKKDKKRKLKQAGHGGHQKKMKNKRDYDDDAVCRMILKSSSKDGKDRWSTERYSTAELKLLDIMKEQGAVLGNPILRPVLREEARKHIGDTGLLDHLLKHMAGKVVKEGTERFRRRHNAEGAMEYWLEPADLMDIRSQAGVSDPFWIPPAGWQPGDAVTVCSCRSGYKQEISHLKDDIAELSRAMEQLISLKLQEKEREEHVKLQPETDLIISRKDWQESYESLLKKNSKLEEEMARMSSCLEALQEEIKVLKEEQKRKEKMGMELVVMEDNSTNGGSSEKERKGDKSNKQVVEKCSSGNWDPSTVTNNTSRNEKQGMRRSGFRICKPQGTFLWPDMGAGNTVDIVRRTPSNQKLQGLILPPQKDKLMSFGKGNGSTAALPATPPSASSATSAPTLLLLPGPSTSTAVATAAAPTLRRTNTGTVMLMIPPPAASPGLRLGLMQAVAEELTASSENICSRPAPAPVSNCHTARARTSTSWPCGRSGEAKKIRNEFAQESLMSPSNWNNNVTTDLALATPSSN